MMMADGTFCSLQLAEFSVGGMAQLQRPPAASTRCCLPASQAESCVFTDIANRKQDTFPNYSTRLNLRIPSPDSIRINLRNHQDTHIHFLEYPIPLSSVLRPSVRPIEEKNLKQKSKTKKSKTQHLNKQTNKKPKNRKI